MFLLFAAAFGLAFLTIKYPLYIPHAAYWIKEGFVIKEHRAQITPNPKILIASGSNSLFGICTPVLEEKIDYKIVNMGHNSATPIEVYFGLIKKYAKPDDIVILPLEYHFYTRNKSLQDWLIRALLTWGTEYIKEFSPKERLEIYLKSLQYLPKRILKFNLKFPVRTYEEYMQHINSKNPLALLRLANNANAYNSFGDIMIDSPSTLPKNFSNAYFNLTDLKETHFQQLKNFADFLAKQNIKLIITYPVTIQNPEFDLAQQIDLNKLQALTNKIKEHGLNIIGIPELSNFEFKFSYNTLYHLNAEGSILRTLYFADMINSYLAGIPQEIPDMEKYKDEKKKEAKKILEEYRKFGHFSEE